MNNNQLCIWYLSGCGIYIEYDKYGLLIDGLFKACQGFSEMPLRVKESIMTRSFPFSNLKMLLFTHKHLDHYDEDVVKEYLHCFPKVQLYNQEDSDNQKRVNLLTPLHFLYGDNRVKIYPIITEHLPPYNNKITHISYIIKINTTHIFISGDAHPTKNKKLLKTLGEFTYAFVNPYFLKLPSGREVLKSMNLQKLFIYHIPFLKDDIYNIQEMTKQCQTLYPKSILLLPEQYQFPKQII